ncbi:MAG TPA: GNAT family N-acetyltransferase [Rhizomicrobium sp.]|jgi:Fur family ferric uptake transcriptional regulator
MRIEPASESDSGQLASLHGRCLADAWDAQAFEALLKSGKTFAQIARARDNALAGVVVCRVAADEAEILTLGVVPECRRAGFGRRLVRAAAATVFAQGAQTLFLEVDVGNTAALSLYRQLGFAEVGRRRGYYRSCDSLADALVLRCRLPIPAWESADNFIKLGESEGSWAMTRIEKLCADKGLRMTDQRRVIARVLSEASDHPDAEELYRRASAVDPHISIATVYRTVRLFEDAGILERHDFRNGRARYEEVPDSHHDHLIDVQTGHVIEFRNEEIERLQKRVAEELGFELIDHRLELYAVPRKTKQPGEI